MSNRVVKSISFNLADPLEKSIYDFVMNKGNFSKVIKMILFSQMQGNQVVNQVVNAPTVQPENEVDISNDIISGYC